MLSELPGGREEDSVLWKEVISSMCTSRGICERDGAKYLPERVPALVAMHSTANTNVLKKVEARILYLTSYRLTNSEKSNFPNNQNARRKGSKYRTTQRSKNSPSPYTISSSSTPVPQTSKRLLGKNTPSFIPILETLLQTYTQYSPQNTITNE